ncbi:MAG: LOG family protein [Nanoarchaeota archaeon]|nr:LOG family protein [Nanoarchaeota archaeon]
MEKIFADGNFEKEIKKMNFRVAIFGSARVKKDTENYEIVKKLAKIIGENDIDIVTGGGPGLMEAANKGHQEGSRNNNSHSLGLLIKLPKEQKANEYLTAKTIFKKFIERLETFLKLSHAVVVAPGGFGTLLELVYTLQVVQVKKNVRIPIILMGPMWVDLVRWMQKWQLRRRFVNIEDFDSIYVVKKPEEAMEIIKAAKELYKNKSQNLCPPLDKYKIKFDKSTKRFGFIPK